MARLYDRIIINLLNGQIDYYKLALLPDYMIGLL